MIPFLLEFKVLLKVSLNFRGLTTAVLSLCPTALWCHQEGRSQEEREQSGREGLETEYNMFYYGYSKEEQTAAQVRNFITFSFS